jgi:hypothetical protein
MSCANSHLEVAKWLWNLNQNINIHTFNEYTFICTCGRGHLKVAKWLGSLNQNINVHAKNDDAFRGSCCYGYVKVVKWLIKHEKNNKHKLLIYYSITSSKLSRCLIRLNILRQQKLKKNKYYEKFNNFFIKN